MVSDPGDDESKDFDDLCVGELMLADVVHKSNHYISSIFTRIFLKILKKLILVRDVSNMVYATLEVFVYYSDKIRDYL